MPGLIKQHDDDDKIRLLLERNAKDIAIMKLLVPKIEAELNKDTPRILEIEGDDARHALSMILNVATTMFVMIEEMRRMHMQ